MLRDNPFIIGGPLSPDSKVYIERSIDLRLFNELLQMNYIHIIQPPQQGKTSLIYRMQNMLKHYKNENENNFYRLIYIAADELSKENEIQWYQEFSNKMLDQINDVLNLKKIRTPKDSKSWKDFLLKIVQLSQCENGLKLHLIVAIDEVGEVPPQVAEAFFRMLRAIYNEREMQPNFKHLSFVLLGSFNPDDLIKDQTISPFNIAIKEMIEDLNLDQIKKLTDMLPISNDLSTLISQQIHSWTEGQPYLTQLTCDYLACHNDTLTLETVKEAIENLISNDNKHLPTILKQITDDVSLIVYLPRLCNGIVRFNPSLNPLQFKLSYNIGIIKSDKYGNCRIKNCTYKKLLLEAGLLDNPVVSTTTKHSIIGTPNNKNEEHLAFREDAIDFSNNETTTHFGFLHLTDFHFGIKEQDWLLPTVKDRFFKDLEMLHKKCGPWDAVLFTGDLTSFGKAKEFKQINTFLCDLWRKFNKLGSNPQLLAIPGNHDLIRPKRKTAAVRLLERWKDFIDIQNEFWEDEKSEYRKVINRALRIYRKWWNNAPFRSNKINNGIIPGDFSVTIEKHGIKIGIVGLNNSFLHLNDTAKGNLAIHPLQFQKVCCGDAPQWLRKHHLSILMTHHPPEWLDDESKKCLKSEITSFNNFIIHLCGHMHSSLRWDESIDDSAPQRVGIGSSFIGIEHTQNSLDRIHGYSVGIFNFFNNKGELVFWPRIFEEIGGSWDFVVDTKKVMKDQLYTRPIEFELNTVIEE